MTAPAHPLSTEEVSALRHDLRTPVNHIVGYCELLLEDAESEVKRTAIQAAIATAREVLAMIESGLPATGSDVTAERVAELRERMRAPHDRILKAMDALHAEGGTEADVNFVADIGRVRHATGQLLAVSRTAVPTPMGVAAITPAAAAAAGTSTGTTRVTFPTGRGHILVVDDIDDNRDVLMRHLTRQGYEVDAAADGATALEMAAAGGYDLMLLDVRMPGIDGREVLERLKAAPGTRDLPIVMISAADELSTIAACIEAGADDFLPKPFDPVILRARVSASVEKKRLRNREMDYLKQVEKVVEAATAIEAGHYTPGSLAEVARRDDSIGHLARVFDDMAAGVKAREERLHDQVSHLRREIDEAQQRSPTGESAALDAGTLLPGTLFTARYRITRVVGRGGMGTVYKAHDLELAEDIAIKLLRPEAISDDPSMAERFKTEIRLARRISHTNVVRTHDFGERDGSYFVTMEYVEGITLRDLIDLRTRLSPASTLGIARQLAASLAVAHEQGVVHRDIKPQNLLLDAAGVLKVMDFGIAKLADRTSTLTQTGMVVGTPAYMAPEQLLAETVDARSDLYAVGIVLYECLTGSLPYEGSNPIALIAKVLHHVPESPHAKYPEIPAPVSSLVMRLIAKDAADRPQTALELGELLAQIE